MSTNSCCYFANKWTVKSNLMLIVIWLPRFFRLHVVICFPALGTGCMFSRALHCRLRVFPCLAPVTCFPAFGTGCIINCARRNHCALFALSSDWLISNLFSMWLGNCVGLISKGHSTNRVYCLFMELPVTLKYCSASATLVGNTLLMKRPNVLVPIHSADSLALKININKLDDKQPIWEKKIKEVNKLKKRLFDAKSLVLHLDWKAHITREHIFFKPIKSSHCFPRLASVTYFIFPRLAPVPRFPALDTGYTLHVLKTG